MEQYPGRGGGGGALPALWRRAARVRAEQTHLAGPGVRQYWTLLPAL